MIKLIRDDVIKLESYVAAAFKYDEELDKIYEVGGYCLLIQLKNKYGETRAKRIVEDMISHKLAETQNYSNCKYLYITQNTLKYLANKNNDTVKINTKRKNIEKNPVEKIIIASIIKYELEETLQITRRTDYIKELKQKVSEINKYAETEETEQLVNKKQKYLKEKDPIIKYTKLIYKLNKNQNQEIQDIIEKAIKKYEHTIQEYEEKIQNSREIHKILEEEAKVGIKLYDTSKIIAIPQDSDTVKIYIIDYSKVKSMSKYISHVNEFEKSIKNIFKNIQFMFISYKKERYNQFKKRLENYLEDNITGRNITLEEISTCYYLEKIIERTNYFQSEPEKIEIKPKDKQAFEKIKIELEKREE